MPRLGEPLEPAHAADLKPWRRVVDAVVQEPQPDTLEALTVPRKTPWPLD
jgi:hypothetical protein